MTLTSFLLSVVAGLLVNECTDLASWLAVRMVRWAVRTSYAEPDRAGVRTEELQAVIAERPSGLFKLGTAAGFVIAAVAIMAGRRISVARARLAQLFQGVAISSRGSLESFLAEFFTGRGSGLLRHLSPYNLTRIVGAFALLSGALSLVEEFGVRGTDGNDNTVLYALMRNIGIPDGYGRIATAVICVLLSGFFFGAAGLAAHMKARLAQRRP